MIYPQIDFEKAVTWCQQRTGKTLAPSQREALKTVLENRVVIITGGPGVGKTTLVNSILTVVLQVSNADKFVAERLSCVLRLPNRKGCR
jgi:putative ribosome biogenesis GTPase RsgA